MPPTSLTSETLQKFDATLPLSRVLVELIAPQGSVGFPLVDDLLYKVAPEFDLVPTAP